jgi:outer membrane protein OmpA-like peptidoglycan-associated protein
LDHLFLTLAKNPSIAIQIVGYTDNQGKEEDLIRLSESRAEAIKSFLVKRGISDGRISVLGKGPKSPLNDNSTDALRALNRRVVVIITRL